MNRTLLLLLATALAAPVPLPAAIDCSRAKTNTEKLLCSNSRLQRADQRMALAFHEAINRGVRPELLMEGQRAWAHDVRDICNDVECMLKAYEERISELEDSR
jgi:uncharacterized protein